MAVIKCSSSSSSHDAWSLLSAVCEHLNKPATYLMHVVKNYNYRKKRRQKTEGNKKQCRQVGSFWQCV